MVGNISAKTGEVFIDQELENGKRYYYTVRAGFGTYLSSFQPSVGVTYSVKLLNRQTTSNVNYRLQPGLNGVKVGTIEKGTQIQVVKGFEKKVDGYTWVQILYNKKIYYLVAEYLK